MNIKRSLIALTIALAAMVTVFVSLAMAQGPDVDLGANEEDVRVIGANEMDWLGEVTASGDVNGDGYEDLIVGASTADFDGLDDDRGAVYVILGRSNLSPTWQVGAAPINLAFYGAGSDDWLGHSVSSGDVNGDGLSDIIMAADGYGSSSTAGNGAVYVFLGRTGLTTATQQIIHLETPGATPPSLIVYGYGDQRLGRSVSAGDVNSDGYDDLIVGAYQSSPAGRTSAGAAYIIVGGSHLTTTGTITVDLATEGAAVTILGSESGDYLGRSVSSGDVNGDGYADLILGTQYADSPTTNNVGAAYVITGLASIASTNPITYDLSTITDTARVAAYYGVAVNDETGFYVASGNVNGDAYDDVIIAAYRADAYWPNSETGKVYVVYGQATLSTTVYLSTEADITIYGAEDDERLGRSIASGDINNDATYDEIIIGASWADRNGVQDTGRVYVIDGGPSLSATINLSETTAADVRIQGDDGNPPGYLYNDRLYGDEAGRSVSVGDVNGDGAHDVIIGAVWAENAAGEVYVVYGGGPITLSITPTNQTIASGQRITYTVTASNTANVRNVSAKTTFTTEIGAGGSWNGNVYTASVAGTWTVTATYQGVVTVTTLVVNNQPPTADTGGAYAGNEGAAIAFDGSGSSDPENALLGYAWDFDDDGQFDDGAGVDPTYTWFDEGTYTATLRVTDSGNLTSTDSATVTVANVAPSIDAVGHTMPTNEGSPITVTVTASDPGNDTLTYGFDWDGDDDFADPGDIASQPSNRASHTWATEGTYTIVVRVDDGDGGVVTATTAIVVNDINPTADFDAAPTSGDEPLTVDFTDASTSYDGITARQWNFGDGLPVSTARNPSHQYTASGVYTVTLTVWEADSDTDTETKVSYITVGDIDPVADFTAAPTSGSEPLTVQFTDASTSYDGITARQWSFGDGSPVSTAQNPSHQYTHSGVYTVTLTVHEADGDSDAETKVSYVTVGDIDPVANFTATPTSGSEPLTVQFTDASTSYDGITARQWSFGDGSPVSTAQNPSHQYTHSGVYTVTLTVWEADGDTDTETKVDYITVNVLPPPTLDHFTLDLPASAEAGQPFEITVTARDQYGNLYPAFNGAVSLSTSAGSISPNNVTLTGGVWTGQVKLTAPGQSTIYVNTNEGQADITITNYRLFLPITLRQG
jgi:PKD repeat protein